MFQNILHTSGHFSHPGTCSSTEDFLGFRGVIERISHIDFTGIAVRCFTTSALYAQRQLTTGIYYGLITSPVSSQYSCFMHLKTK